MSDDNQTDKKPPKPKLFEGDLKPGEYARTVHVVTAPTGATAEDYLEAETYAHVMRKVRQGDHLEITAEDRTWYAHVFIVSVAGQFVHAAILEKHTFSPMLRKEHDEYEENWGGPGAKWRVLRKSDRAVMVDKLEEKSQAVAWIEQNAGKKPEPLKKAA